jgi:hypothetical protein
MAYQHARTMVEGVLTSEKRYTNQGVTIKMDFSGFFQKWRKTASFSRPFLDRCDCSVTEPREPCNRVKRVYRTLKQGEDIRRNAGQIGRPLPVLGRGYQQKCWRFRQVRHSACWIMAALCLALTGCGQAQNLYTPIAGLPQTQPAESAYWDCVGQNFNREATSDPGAWVFPGAEWQGREAYMRACMGQKGWANKYQP